MDDVRKTRFLELLEPIYPQLTRYALAMSRNREEAKDLVSEAVLIALERFDSIRDEAGFPGFLFRIVSRTYKHWHYRERLWHAWHSKYAETLVAATSPTDRRAEVAVVLAALERLPLKTKEAILLYDVADLSLDEIRKIQGGTLSGVKSRLRRGHTALQHLLGVKPENFLLVNGAGDILKGVETYAV